MKGWSHYFKMFASVIAYFNCLLAINYFFFSAFIAYKTPVSIFLTKKTFPKAPEPNFLIISNDLKLTLLSVNKEASIYWFSDSTILWSIVELLSLLVLLFLILSFTSDEFFNED